MAFPLQSQPKSHQSSLSCNTMLYSGLKLQSPSTVSVSKPNLSVEFYSKVHKNLHSRSHNHKAARGQVKMMPIGTPRIPYKSGDGAWQWIDIWNALYRERIIFIGQDINEEFGNQLLATMLYLDSVDDSKRLYFYINGAGGELTPSLSIYDTMHSLKSPLGTYCIGFAFNLVGYILAAGDKGHRFAMPLCSIVLQSPAGAARGQADDIRNEAEELVRVRDYLYKELSKKTGQPIDKIYKDLRSIKRFNGQEAMEYGIVDRVVRVPDVNEEPRRKTKDPTKGLL